MALTLLIGHLVGVAILAVDLITVAPLAVDLMAVGLLAHAKLVFCSKDIYNLQT